VSFFLFPLSLFQTEIRGDPILTFQDVQLRLLAYVRSQIRNGELTERGFARLIGISQPHVHNVLKGVRSLSPKFFDLTLKYLHLSLLDLVTSDELEAHHRQRRPLEPSAEVPFLDRPIGPGMPWPRGLNPRKNFPLPFPGSDVPSDLVMAGLSADPFMLSTLANCDVALLDTSHSSRSKLAPHGLFVVERGNEAVLRFIRPGAQCYYLASDATLDTPAEWEPLLLSAPELIAAVKARVRWIGRERDRDLLPQRGRFLYDPISS
jgi:hypothetical protein